MKCGIINHKKGEKVMKKTIKTLLIFALIMSLGTTYAFAFSDAQVHWAKETIDWAVQKGVAKGYPDGTFKPNNHVTEAEFLAMLIRTFEGEKAGGSHWADGYYTFARLMNYPTYGSQDVNKRSWLITRKQVAEIVAGTQGVNYTGNDAIHYLLLNGLAKGKDPSNLTIASFEGDATLTRAEAVQFIKNVLENGVDKLQPRPTSPSPALPEIGENDRIVPLVPVDETKPQQPQQPQVPEQPVPPVTGTPEQPTDPKRDKNNNSPEIIEKRLQEAFKLRTPEFGITKEDIEYWAREMYRLGQKAEIVDGKLRLYYPQIPEDKKDKWWIGVDVDTPGKRESAVYGAYGKLHDSPANDRQGRTIPEYDDFNVSGDYSFYISLQYQVDPNYGGKPVASVGYNSETGRISVNSYSVEWNHKK